MIEHLERITLKEPGPIAAEMLVGFGHFKRGMPKSNLQPRDGKCAWCEAALVKRRSGKYCSTDCNQSALFNCYPQHASSKLFILIELQGCKCAGCGDSYRILIQRRVHKLWEQQRKYVKTWLKKDHVGPITYWQIGNNTGELWHVDHIVPIYKGGSGIGLKNVQVLCVPCHKKKTVIDLRRNG